MSFAWHVIEIFIIFRNSIVFLNNNAILFYAIYCNILCIHWGGGRSPFVSTLYMSVICPCTIFFMAGHLHYKVSVIVFLFRLCMSALTMAGHGRRWTPIYRPTNGNQCKDSF